MDDKNKCRNVKNKMFFTGLPQITKRNVTKKHDESLSFVYIYTDYIYKCISLQKIESWSGWDSSKPRPRVYSGSVPTSDLPGKTMRCV